MEEEGEKGGEGEMDGWVHTYAPEEVRGRRI